MRTETEFGIDYKIETKIAIKDGNLYKLLGNVNNTFVNWSKKGYTINLEKIRDIGDFVDYIESCTTREFALFIEDQFYKQVDKITVDC